MPEDVQRDIHVLRYFSSFVSVSDGSVINVTDPVLSYCPLAGHLYKGLRDARGMDKQQIKREIGKAIESKIREHGLFTEKRKLLAGDTAIPYGASEMLLFALKNKAVDAVVVVCDGAGTLITDNGEVAQGIGARMNSLVLTSPIKGVIDRLRGSGCHVISDNALIDQVRGVEKAIASGYKKISVTVSGHDAERLEEIRALEEFGRVSVTVLVVCTTLASASQIGQIRKHADIVWSCASEDIRSKVGPAALLQISKQIPVFVMTRKGIDLVAACADEGANFSDIDGEKRYLVSHEPGGRNVRLCGHPCFLREEGLPVLSGKSFAMAN
jgi:putative methanogenesis marker protein 8